MISLREKIKKITVLRYALHAPRDMVTTINYRRQMKSLENRQVKQGKDLEVFKDRFKGERCFIIGLGPSLTCDDLELLKGEKCFSSNRIVDMFDKTSWRPYFYMSGDPMIASKIGKDLNRIVDECNYTILNLAHVDRYGSYPLDKENVYYYKTICGTGFDMIRKEKGKFPNKIDLTGFIDSVGTITYEMMETAIYMGFKEIYLLGVDHYMGGGSNNHFQGIKFEDNDLKKYQERAIPVERWTKGYEHMKKIAEGKGASIINCTRGGHLEVYERKTLESVLGE